jgi:hypothetical protein
MLALICMNNIWRILFALLIPLNLAMVCIYADYLLMHGYKNCDFCFACYAPLGCVGELREFLSELLGYLTIGLILLSIFLPIIILLRNKSVEQAKLFE